MSAAPSGRISAPRVSFSSTSADSSLTLLPPPPPPPPFRASFAFLGTPFRLPAVASVAAAVHKDAREPRSIVSVGRTHVPDALRLRLDGSLRHVASVRIERAGLRDTYRAEIVYGGRGETVTLRRYVGYAEVVDAICASVAGVRDHTVAGGGSGGAIAHPYVRGNAEIRELSVQWQASAPENCVAKIRYQLSSGTEAATADAFDLEIRQRTYADFMFAISRALGQR